MSTLLLTWSNGEAFYHTPRFKDIVALYVYMLLLEEGEAVLATAVGRQFSLALTLLGLHVDGE